MNNAPHNKACAEARQQLSAFLDGALDDAQSTLHSVHLTDCAECQEWMDAEAMLEQDLSRAFAAARPIAFSWWKAAFMSGTAAAAAVVLTLLLVQPTQNDPIISVDASSTETAETAMQEVGVGSFDDASRQDLEAEVGRLLAENASLRLQARGGGQASAESMDPDVLVQAVGYELQSEEQSTGSQWRSARAAASALTGRESASVAPIERHLLGAKDDAARRVAGLRLCRMLKLPQATRRILPFLKDQAPEVSREAVEALGSQRDPESRDALLGVFQRSTDQRMRIAAAGALVRHGDYGAPLEFLKRMHRAPGLDQRTRTEVLARVMLAPIARSDSFLVGVLVAADTDTETREALVEMLGRIDTQPARAILEHVEMAGVDAELKRLVRNALKS
ncbi:MAG: hypothetical protein EXS14_01295 [Planctomycetes bacterium]|nr:hypothetical protein [Planctomycetota bacterium]